VKLSRRFFLRAASGATLSLPVLESLLPRAAWGQAPTKGFAFFMRQANGCAQATVDGEPERFWPRATGALTSAQLSGPDADRALSELSAYADKLNVVKGINYPFGNNHGGGGAQCLTAARTYSAPGSDGNAGVFAEGESIDNRIARTLDNGAEPLALYAGPMFGYVNEVLSYRGARNRRGAERNPFNVYSRLMGLTTPNDPKQQQIAQGRTSVNDLVRTELRALMGMRAMSQGDKQKLQQHLDAVRDLEVKMACTVPTQTASAVGAYQNGVQVDWTDGDVLQKIARLHLDLLAYAFGCGLVHAATLQVGDGLDQTRFVVPTSAGGTTRLGAFHPISHRATCDGCFGDASNPGQMAEYHHQIDRIHARLFKYFLDQLSARGIVDQGVSCWCFDISNKFHDTTNVPYILAGSGNGYLKTGQVVNVGGSAHNRLFNTIINATGVRQASGALVDDFGDASLPKGEVTALKA